MDEDLSEQTKWFHEFARQPLEEVARQANDENRARFARYATTSLPSYTPPDGLPPEEFAMAVGGLRANEKKWNQALMSALVEADDLHRTQDTRGAVAMLEAFAGACPWSLFKEVAQRQASHYSGR